MNIRLPLLWTALLVLASAVHATDVAKPRDADLAPILTAAFEDFIHAEKYPVFLGLGSAVDQLEDPPAAVFEGKPYNVYRASEVESVTPGRGVRSDVSPDAGELVFADILRVEERRAYLLVHTYRSGKNTSASILTLIPLDEKWVVVSKCLISRS